MQEVKYRVVRKKLEELRKGDAIWPPSQILAVDKSDLREQPIHIGATLWPSVSLLQKNGTINDDSTYNIMELIEDVAESATTEAQIACPHTEIRNGAEQEVKGIIFDGETYIKQEKATTKTHPAPETATTEINGERFTVTRKACGGWSEPVPWKPAVGDEVRLSDLTDGDRVLVYGVVDDRVGEAGRVGIRLPNGNDCVKWFRPSDKVIYNGRAE